MKMSNFSSRKRPRTRRRIVLLTQDNDEMEAVAHEISAPSKSLGRRKGTIPTYHLAFCSCVLLVQLARVHSWSPMFTSSIAKKSTPTAVTQVPGHPDASDSIYSAFFLDRPRIPSSDLLSSRYLLYDPKNLEKNHDPSTMSESSPSGSRSPVAPSMLLRDDSFFPAGTKSVAASRASTESIRRGIDGAKIEGTSHKNREGRVLGFDLFELHANRPDSPAGAENQVSATTGASRDDSEGFLPVAGLNWETSPLSSNTNANDEGEPSFSPAAATQSKSTGGITKSNTGVRLLRYSSPLIPAWFPWIPTKSQIMTLKLKELREACSQRGLAKSGNKDVLQERLWGWTVEHQMQHQARLLSENFWFQEVDDNDTNSFLSKQTRQEQERNKDRRTEGDYSETNNENNTPNSLAEWSRSIDTEKLTQKRQEIHRQKRVGKNPDAFHTSSSPSTRSDMSKNTNNFKSKRKHTESPAATKEYLTKLSNAMKTSPSSPYASNRDVRELYDASKKADQLGEPLLAIELLESLIKLTPNDARIYRRLSRMHNDQGNLNVARATLQQGLRKLPHNPWLWHGMGHLELSQGRVDYGVRCYQRAIKEDPAFAHSYHAWGIHEFNNGQIAKSMKILKKGIEYCPTNHRLHHALGDLYRGAKLPKDAERSYRRALEEGPPVSHGFALSALASVAYEQDNVEEARRWLYQSIETNEGRHAQGWLALAEIEEAEGNVEQALKVCEASIIRYEKGLIEARKRYKRDSRRMNQHPHGSSDSKLKREQKRHGGHREGFEFDKSFTDPTESKEVERGLLKSIPKYRSGDKFLSVFRHWARLEGRYGLYDECNRVYERASIAFPLDHKISLDWARYHANIQSHLASRHFAEACNRSSNKDAEPYREYASYEMSLGEYEQAQTILFRGAQTLARSQGGVTGRKQLELARLYVTWAVCEWHLRNTSRVEVLFDHALCLTEVGSDEGSELRSFVLFCMAQLEYYERKELRLAQHCIGLCLKENSLPGGNAPIWNLWAKIARGLKNSRLEEKCKNEAKLCKMRLEDPNEDEREGSSALDTMNMLKESQNIQNLMRQEPWFDKLRAVRMSWFDNNDESSTRSSFSKFYSSIILPDFEDLDLRRRLVDEEQEGAQSEEAQVVSSEGMPL